jgi:MoaA/NifB/PqqE/SkfB family radical SAM enzyme
MCSIRYQGRNDPTATTEQIIKDMIRGRNENYERIEFSGGEPTVRKDLLFLIRYAKKLGYRTIGINTNGILLSNKSFCDELVKEGVNSISFSLHAHNKSVYGSITRNPSAFAETVNGIKNALQYKDISIQVTTVMLKTNYLYIDKIGKLLFSMGVHFWNITDLLPDGFAQQKYKSLCVRRTDVSRAIIKLKPLLDNSAVITFYAFSPCLIPSDILKKQGIGWVTAQQKIDVEDTIRYLDNPSSNYTGKKYTQLRLKRIDICNKCKFTKECPGIWLDYLNLFGDKEIRTLAIKHGYIKH